MIPISSDTALFMGKDIPEGDEVWGSACAYMVLRG